jgi:DNA-binding transcriptional regulator YhcF (GntR family)
VKIWISKNSEVPVRQQLVAQVTLGIASGDLKVAEKLPSTREIARRCGVHSNTVSSAYQDLSRQGLLEFRKGSGFYVAESAGERIEGTRRLEQLISTFLESAKALGFEEPEIFDRLKKSRVSRSTDTVAVVESDHALRKILVHEIAALFPNTIGVTFEEFKSGYVPTGAILAAMFDEKPKIEAAGSDDHRCVYLKGRSVSAAMSGETRPEADATVAVVSGWDGFLTYARIMLLAAKVESGNLIVRSTADSDWQNSVKRASIIICDSLTASEFGEAQNVRAFRIVSDESIADLAASIPRN